MKKKTKAGFLGGALLGLGIGVLFAPKTGVETRKMLADKTSELWDKIRGMDADEIKDKLENKLKEIEKDLKDLDKEKVLNIAKEKSENIKKKCQDLVELAIEKGTPVLKDAAVEVRDKTIDVMCDMVNKLENLDFDKDTKKVTEKK